MKISWVVLLLQRSSSLSRKQEQDACYLLYFYRITNLMLFVWFSVDAVVARYKHEHIVEGLSLREPVSRVSELWFLLFNLYRNPSQMFWLGWNAEAWGECVRQQFSLFEVLLRSGFYQYIRFRNSEFWVFVSLCFFWRTWCFVRQSSGICFLEYSTNFLSNL